MRDEARRLRSSGISYRLISIKLGIPRSTIVNWTKSVILSEDQKTDLSNKWVNRGITIKTDAIERKNKYVNYGKELYETSELFRHVCYLYWAEGGKNGSRSVSFVNGDVIMLKFFIKWLNSMNVKNDNIKVQIHYCSKVVNNNLKSIWSNLLGIKIDNIYKIRLVKARRNKDPDGYIGVANLIVCNVNLYHVIIGGIEKLKSNILNII